MFKDLEDSSTSPIPKHELIQIFRTGMFWSSLVVVIVSMVVALQIVLSKWRPVRVFFSYQLKDISLMKNMRNALHKQGIQAQLCYFDSPNHDDVIAAVQSGIRACDTLLVLPGTEPSFVDAEILAATVARKAVVMIDSESQTLPNTAYEGYPVFVLAKLQKEDFRALVSFLSFVHGRLASINAYRNDLMFMISLVFTIMFWIPLVILSFVATVSPLLALYFFGLNAAMKVFIYASIAEIVLPAGLMLVSVVWANFDRLLAARVVRQSIITRTTTYEILAGCLPTTEDILSCLKVSALKKRHI